MCKSLMDASGIPVSRGSEPRKDQGHRVAIFSMFLGGKKHLFNVGPGSFLAQKTWWKQVQCQVTFAYVH